MQALQLALLMPLRYENTAALLAVSELVGHDLMAGNTADAQLGDLALYEVGNGRGLKLNHIDVAAVQPLTTVK